MYLRCKINGLMLYLMVERKKLPKVSYQRPANYADRTPCQPGNVWPWRYMEKGDVVYVPFKLATYYQIVNSIRGFVSHRKGAKFRYRCDENGVSVWCFSKKVK